MSCVKKKRSPHFRLENCVAEKDKEHMYSNKNNNNSTRAYYRIAIATATTTTTTTAISYQPTMQLKVGPSSPPLKPVSTKPPVKRSTSYGLSYSARSLLQMSGRMCD